MMEIRWAVKEDLPQINQLITDHPESFVKAKTAADLNDKNKLLLIAVTKEKQIIGFAQADVQQSEERLDQRPSGKLIQHISNKRKYERNPKKICRILDAGS